MVENSIENNKAIENLNNKLLEIMNDGGIIDSQLLYPLSKNTNPENTREFKLLKDYNSNRFIDLLIHISVPITLHDNLLTYRDTNKQFELKKDFLTMITNENYNVVLAKLSDKNLMYDFAKEMNFDLKAQGNKSTQDRTVIKLPKSQGLMVSASVVSKTMFLTSDPDELCDIVKLILQEKQVGNNSEIIKDEIFAIVDKILKYKCISKKQHRQLLTKCKPLHEQV